MAEAAEPRFDPYGGVPVDDVWYGSVAEDDELEDEAEDEVVLVDEVDLTERVDLTGHAEAIEGAPTAPAVAVPQGPPGMFVGATTVPGTVPPPPPPPQSTMTADNTPGTPRGFAPLPTADDVPFTYIPPAPAAPGPTVDDGSGKKKSRWRGQRSD